MCALSVRTAGRTGASGTTAGAPAAGDARDVIAGLSEAMALALTVWGEARGETPDGQVAVAQVILHRRTTGRWGASVNSVVGARLQFSCWWPQGGAENFARLMTIAQQVQHGEVVPALRPSLWVAAGLLDGAWTRDLVKGATHYMTRELWLRKPPPWARGVVPVATVGSHVFFAGVR